MERITLSTFAGNNVTDVTKEAIRMATELNQEVEFDFNEVNCIVDKNTDPELLVRDYMNAHRMEWKEIGPAPALEYSTDVQADLDKRTKEAEERMAKMREENEARVKKEKEAIVAKVSDVEFELSNEDEWKGFVESNSDPYGSACVRYAETWALLMKAKMIDDMVKDADVLDWMQENASDLSHEADTEGITGFMYGAAVQMLSKCWKYGEDLRKWHNKEYDHEGDGVVNPAIINVNVKDEE